MSIMVRVSGAHRGVHELMDPGPTVADVLDRLNLSRQVYIAALDGEIVPVDTALLDGAELDLIQAVAGG